MPYKQGVAGSNPAVPTKPFKTRSAQAERVFCFPKTLKSSLLKGLGETKNKPEATRAQF
jgi:hypothetical protein